VRFSLQGESDEANKAAVTLSIAQRRIDADAVPSCNLSLCAVSPLCPYGLLHVLCCREDLMEQMKGLQQQADDGDIPGVPMTEVPSDDASSAADSRSDMPGSVADAVVDSVVKAGEVVGDAVAQAKDAAAAAVGKAGSFLKNTLKSFVGAGQEAEL
jgi:hypothetical protein